MGDETSEGGGVNGSSSLTIDTGGVDTGSCRHLFFAVFLPLLFFLLGEKKTARQLGAELLVHKCAWSTEQKEMGETSCFLQLATTTDRPSFYPNAVICQSPQCLPQLLGVYLAELGSASSLVRAVVNEIKGLGIFLLPLGATLELVLFFLALLELHCSCAAAVGTWSCASSVLTWTH